ncbi:hypothetical protein predicted by Glimmer/Critica [Sorangium cellulosum So ce56]|uniref:Beta-lactamase-related domain-containing protein n=1 Tax=Sorangium cellulosum (strain So ce56) TaxID=448385 RepID=A9GJQ7_SORC5|nr:hypothetical protein predicted by Glimmer/Critica [Sorangium cellulosum So ce56]
MNERDPIARAVGAIVDSGALANAATMVWRHGEVVQRASVGWRDLEARLPLEHDSLFRIASMTKPITSTAARMLFEEGRFTLTDPISRWAPEFSDMRVLRSPTGPLDETDPAERTTGSMVRAASPRASPVQATRRSPNGPMTWTMSPAARGCGRRWTTISRSRASSWEQAPWMACESCGPKPSPR